MIPSIRHRYAQKLLASVISLVLGMIPLVLLPRAFSPSDLGNMDFVVSIATSFFGSLSLGIPIGFTNWAARKGPEGASAGIDYLLKFIFGLGTFALLLSLLSLQFSGTAKILANIGPKLLFIGVFYAWLVFVFQTFGQVFDALVFTKESEILKTIQSFIRAAFCVGLFGVAFLNPISWLSLQSAAIIAALVGYVALWHSRVKKHNAPSDSLSRREFSQFAHGFIKHFSFYNLFGLVYEAGDRFILQFYGGSAQQGYYSLAQRLSGVMMMFTVAFVPILQREFAYEAERNNYDRLNALLHRNRLFLSIVITISVFAAIFSQEIIGSVTGQNFAGSIPVFAVMALYPIHQTMGQLSNFLLVSVGRAKVYTSVGNVFLGLSLIVSYFVIAPSTNIIPGLGLGALGFAVKLIVLQFIFNNIYLFLLCRAIRASYKDWVWFQVKIPIYFGAIAFLCHLLTNRMLDGSVAILVAGSVLYASFTAVVFLKQPQIFGLRKEEINTLFGKVLTFCKVNT